MGKKQNPQKGERKRELKIVVNGVVDLSLMPPEVLNLLAATLERKIFDKDEESQTGH